MGEDIATIEIIAAGTSK